MYSPPPEVSREIEAVGVNLTTSLETVIQIEERTHIIELKFDLQLEWYEYRAKYHNLKINPALNILSNSELESLWIPFIIFKVCVLCTETSQKVKVAYIL